MKELKATHFELLKWDFPQPLVNKALKTDIG